MVADMDIVRYTGVAGSLVETPVTASEFYIAQNDSPEPLETDIIPLPAPAATEYSWWAHLRMKANTAPAGTADNLRVFAPNGDEWAGTGVTLVGLDASTAPDSGYEQPTTDEALTQANHGGLDGAAEPSNLGDYTAASPLALGGSIVATTGAWGDYLVIQAQVSDSAVDADLPGFELTFRRDET